MFPEPAGFNVDSKIGTVDPNTGRARVVLAGGEGVYTVKKVDQYDAMKLVPKCVYYGRILQLRVQLTTRFVLVAKVTVRFLEIQHIYAVVTTARYEIYVAIATKRVSESYLLVKKRYYSSVPSTLNRTVPVGRVESYDTRNYYDDRLPLIVNEYHNSSRSRYFLR